MPNILTAVPEYPSDNWNLVGSTVLTGLVVVFIALVLLIAAFWLIGVFFAQNSKTRAMPDNTPAPPPVLKPADPAELSEPAGKATEAAAANDAVIAVIAAAIAAYGEADGKAYRINSVRMAAHTMRKPWNAAGLAENMRGF